MDTGQISLLSKVLVSEFSSKKGEELQTEFWKEWLSVLLSNSEKQYPRLFSH